MERISYTIQMTEDKQERYLLSIDYENETYEKLIDASSFSSSQILLSDLDKAIMEGLQLNRIREFPRLEIITILDKKEFSVSCAQDHLLLILDCNMCSRTRKRRKEIFTFALYKKKRATTARPNIVQNSHPFTNPCLDRSTMNPCSCNPNTNQYTVTPNAHFGPTPATHEKPIGMNRPNSTCHLPESHRIPRATAQDISQVIRNLFVNLDFISKEIIAEEVDHETGAISSVPLLSAGKFEMEFFIFLLHNNADMFAFYNTPNSTFANLQEYAIKKISELFDSFKIHELILNFYNKKYYTYFSKILSNGSKIWINYDTEMTPRNSEFVLSKNMQEFVFHQHGPQKKMKFLQEIEFNNPTQNLPKLFLCSEGIRNFREKTSNEKMYLKDTVSGKLFQLDESGKITPPLTTKIFTNAGISLHYPKDLSPMTSRYFSHGQAITLLQKKSKPVSEFFYLLESVI